MGINFRLGGWGGNLPNSGGGEVKFPFFHDNNVTEKIANVELSFRFFLLGGDDIGVGWGDIFPN